MGDGSPERGLRVWLGVRLAAFTNLDLLQQGDYRVRCALQLRGPAEGARGRALAPEHTFAPASIAFIDQRVEVEELAEFEAVVPRAGARTCYLEFELLFREAPTEGAGGPVAGAAGLRPRLERVVARETFHVRNLGESLCEYVPLHFDRFHLALADVLVAATPLETTSEEPSFSGRELESGEVGAKLAGTGTAGWNSVGQLFLGGCCSTGGESAQYRADRCACALIAAAGGEGGHSGFSDISFETHEGLRRSLKGLLKLLGGLLGGDGRLGAQAVFGGADADPRVGTLSELAARCAKTLQREAFSGSDVLQCSREFRGVLQGVMGREGAGQLLGLLRGVWEGWRADTWGKYVELAGNMPSVRSEALVVPEGAAPPQLHDLRFEAPSSEVPLCSVEHFLCDSEGAEARKAGGEGAGAGPGSDSDGRRVVIFVHGFQGDALDLRVVKGYLHAAHPDIHYLMSRSNVDYQYDGFEELGARLAEEVSSYLDSVHHEHLDSLSLSFVAHSVGCIVVRAALLQPPLQRFRPRLSAFVSLCGPHLGLARASNALLTSGMRVLQHVKQAKWIAQALLEDAGDPERGFLHRLAREGGLGEFRSVVLVGSRQDRYVPFYSTMADAGGAGAPGPCLQEAARLMLRGTGTGGRKLLRLHVQFSEAPFGVLDNFIGRAAHIAFLENDVYIRVLVWNIIKAHRLV